MAQEVDEARVAAAIKGALLADAASMGTHNMMDPEEIEKAVPSKDAPEFKDPPAPVGYSAAEYPGHYGPGMLSPWGEQMLFATEYVGKEQLVTAGPMSVGLMKWAESFNGYQDEGIKEFLTCMKAGDRSVELCGQEDERAAAYARIIPTVCLYAGEGDMLERVIETVMIYQTCPKAIRFCCAAASILEKILLGKTLKESLEELINHAMSGTTNYSTNDGDIGDACLDALMQAKMSDLPQLMESLESDEEKGGRTAKFPAAFIVPMFIFYKSTADGDITEESYVKAIRSNILAGGDTCLRAIVLGAIFGAAAGSVPASFEEKFPKETMEKVEKAIKGICSVLN